MTEQKIVLDSQELKRSEPTSSFAVRRAQTMGGLGAHVHESVHQLTLILQGHQGVTQLGPSPNSLSHDSSC